MEFNIKKLEETDFDTLLGWWNDWGWTVPPKDFLPENGTGGILILDGDVPVCAGFVYITNSAIGWVDFIVSSKTYRKKPHRKDALELLINTLTNIARNSGCKYSYSLLKNSSLISIYESQGYFKGDNNISEMIKIL